MGIQPTSAVGRVWRAHLTPAHGHNRATWRFTPAEVERRLLERAENARLKQPGRPWPRRPAPL